jgi:hypothetical protein
MGYRTLWVLAVALASVPAAAFAESELGAVPTLPLRPPPGAHDGMGAGQTMQWHAPPRPRGWVWGRPGWWGGSHQPAIRGYILPSYWLSPAYVIPYPAGYGLADAGWERRWVRYYDDAVLVDQRGLIYDSVHNVAWDRYSQGPVPAYVGDAPEMAPSYGAGYEHGYDDEVTWDGGSARSDRQIWAWPSNSHTDTQGNIVIVVPPGSSTTITFQPQPVVTTTSTYYEVEAPRAAPAYKARPRVKEQPRSSTPPRVIGRVPVKKS